MTMQGLEGSLQDAYSTQHMPNWAKTWITVLSNRVLQGLFSPVVCQGHSGFTQVLARGDLSILLICATYFLRFYNILMSNPIKH